MRAVGCSAALASLLVSLGAAAAQADDTQPQQKLEGVQRDLDQTRRDSAALAKEDAALQAELTQLQAQLVQAAAAAQDNERQVTTEERALAQLQHDQADETALLARRRAHEAAVLSALERLAAVPPTAMAFAPGSPVDLARGGMLMSAAVPRLEAEARDLLTALDQLVHMAAAIDARRTALAERQRALDTSRQNIAQLLQRRQTLAGETRAKAAAAQKHEEALVAEAGDLRQAIEKIERERAERLKEEASRAAAVAGARVPAGPGPRLAVPVEGDLVQKFGATEDYGTAKGLSFATRPNAQIVAPCAGEVMFSGPFRGYGQILIIDHGGGYHLLMAGIGRLQASVGQKLIAGEPVGTMASDGTPTLYLELRRDGSPVDPLPSLAGRDGKASG